ALARARGRGDAARWSAALRGSLHPVSQDLRRRFLLLRYILAVIGLGVAIEVFGELLQPLRQVSANHRPSVTGDDERGLQRCEFLDGVARAVPIGGEVPPRLQGDWSSGRVLFR